MACTASSIPCGRGDLLDQADRALQRADRVVLEPEGQRELEHHLGVRRAVNVRKERRVDGQHEIAPNVAEAAEVPVVREQPAAVTERVAVRLLHR